jgi:hypothetical protein
MLVILLCGLVTGTGAGVIASNKGRSGFGYFLLGFFFSIVGLLIAIGMPALNAAGTPRQLRANDLVVCHACRRPHRADAISCPSCGVGAPDPHAHEKKCPACAEWVLQEARKCKHCGEDLGAAVVSKATASGRPLTSSMATARPARSSGGARF